MTTIATIAELEALYGPANPASLTKETHHLTQPYRRWIETAPFFAIATSGPDGLDCSPRGDPAGDLMHVLDDRTLVYPDRRGNNRIDTLRNLIADPRVALLFLIPGVSEAMRVNGSAVITTDAAMLARFTIAGKIPVCAIVVTIDSVYFQCARAIMRARLWDQNSRPDRAAVPTAGAMVQATDPNFPGEKYDEEAPARLQAGLY